MIFRMLTFVAIFLTSTYKVARMKYALFGFTRRVLNKGGTAFRFTKICIIVSLFQTPLIIQAGFSQTPDAYVKINRLDKIIKIMDQSVVSTPAETAPTSSPGAMIKGLLQGTDWIDPSRSIVIGITFASSQPDIFFFIPFIKPNDNFRTSYHAIKGSDYYIISLSSGRQNSIVHKETLEALKNAAQSRADALISIEIEVKRLLDGRHALLMQLIRNMPLSSDGQSVDEMMLTPAEIRSTLLKMLAKARQLVRITANTDFDDRIFKTAFKASAVKGSEIARLFASGGRQSFLQGYLPEAQIRFQSQSFDVKGMIELINACFGTVYAKSGIDFNHILKISPYFTGESTGGISYSHNRMFFEMISVLDDRQLSENFVETIYLPWLLEYGQNMSRILEKQITGRMRPLYKRALDSTVSGHKVVGVKGQWPVLDYSKTANGDVSWLRYRMRITTHNNFLIIAPNDNLLKKSIQLANKFKKQPVGQTPLMKATVDLNGYLEQMNHLRPKNSGDNPSVKKMGAIQVALTFKDREAVFTSSMRIKDIRTLETYFETQPVSKKRPPVKLTESEKKQTLPKSPVPVKRPRYSEPAVKNADYWLNKGLICATYGNDSTAVRYYKKALALSPQRGAIWFNQGISYGEMGDFVEAIIALNKALELGFSEGLGLYGRARVYLLAGETSKALEDFRHAAALGNRDAANYLEKTGIKGIKR